MRIQKPFILKNDHLLLYIKVIPAASQTKLAKLHDNRIVIKVQAAPEKGKANKAVTAFFSKLLGIHKNDISIIQGDTSHLKTLRIPLCAEIPVINILNSLIE